MPAKGSQELNIHTFNTKHFLSATVLMVNYHTRAQLLQQF
jgi:hypothetical protein